MKIKRVLDIYGVPFTIYDEENITYELFSFYGGYKRVTRTKEEKKYFTDRDGHFYYIIQMIDISANTIRNLLTDESQDVYRSPVINFIKVHPKKQSYNILNRFDNLDVKLNK